MNQINSQAKSPQDSSSYDLFNIASKIALTVIIMFTAGYFLTLASEELLGYKNFPNEGGLNTQADGTPVFSPKYTFFRGFIYSAQDVPLGREDNKFKRVGLFGRGLFFYSVLNAPHWICEVSINNLRGLVLYPLIVVIFGCGFFFFMLLPEKLQTRKNALSFSITLGVLHSLIVAGLLLLGCILSPTFHSMFNAPFYIGELTGALIPAYFIIIFTGLFYGAIAGGILSGFAYMMSAFNKFVPTR